MPKSFKDRLQKLVQETKEKQAAEEAEAKNPNDKKMQEELDIIQQMIPKEDRSYLPETVPVRNRPENSTLQEYTCYKCNNIFVAAQGVYNSYNEPRCERCRRENAR